MFIKIYDEIPEEAKTIREAVFIKEQGFKDEFDEIDDVAKHVLLFAVRKEFRGRRYGEKVLQGAEKAVRDLGGKVVELSAQCRVADFYNKQGYTGLNDIHMDEYCPHTWMRKELDPACILNEKGK